MGRFMTDLHRRIKGKNITPFAAAARTAAAPTSAVIDTREANHLVLTLTTTAKTGTSPTLDMKVQTSEDGSTNWVDVASGAFTQVTSGTSLPNTQLLIVGKIGAYCRLLGAIGGSATPGYTFGITGYTK